MEYCCLQMDVHLLLHICTSAQSQTKPCWGGCCQMCPPTLCSTNRVWSRYVSEVLLPRVPKWHLYIVLCKATSGASMALFIFSLHWHAQQLKCCLDSHNWRSNAFRRFIATMCLARTLPGCEDGGLHSVLRGLLIVWTFQIVCQMVLAVMFQSIRLWTAAMRAVDLG